MSALRLLLVAAVAASAACSDGDRARAPSPKVVAAPEAVAVQPPVPQPRPDWVAKRAFPQAPAKAPTLRIEAPPAPPAAKATEPPAGPPPLPFAYTGRLTVGAERYAVLGRDGAVFMVRAGDVIGGKYRVQSIRDELIVLFNLDFGVAQSIAYSSAAGPRGAAPQVASAAGASIDDVSLRLSGPSQVAIGEQFTLMLSLDSGMNVMLESGRVELRFDPKVLQLNAAAGKGAADGSARVEISGAYPGHPAPSMVQFQVVAQAPTATEIRVVPTSIADSEGRNLGIDAPQPYRLAIVAAASAKGK